MLEQYGCRLNIFALLLVTTAGCATVPPEGAKTPPQRTHYTLRKGPTTTFTPPLPSRTELYVDWHWSDGRTESQVGFVAWEAGSEGRYEMIEVLGDDGKPLSYIYDFDGDGQPDQTVDAAPGPLRRP